MRLVAWILGLWFLLAAGYGAAWGLSTPRPRLAGQVLRVLDGDTFDMQVGTTRVRIRLYGIDAPETSQAYGPEATQALAALVQGATVTVETHGRDRDRLIGDAWLSNGVRVSAMLVSQGWAWWYVDYAPRASELGLLEQSARRQYLGLWASAAPMAPWLWRRQQRCP